MKIKWLGHSSFLITSDSGFRIITDPYTPDNNLRYDNINETADVVTVSHEHLDHNNIGAIKGNPVILKKSAVVKGINFKAVQASHDSSGGKIRGQDLLFYFNVDGVKLCHLGDLGQLLDDKQVAEIGAVDVLFIPAGGYFTIEPDIADQVINKVLPKVVIPMHFQTEQTNLPFNGVDKFLKGKRNVKRLDTSEIEVKLETLPKTMEIIVLKPEL